MKFHEIAIIGAGASGLTAASMLKGRDVCLIESNAEIGEKIKISGGGKCNFTNENVTSSHYLGDPHFISEVLKGFDQKAVFDFFTSQGVTYEIKKKGQYFCKQSALEILSFFTSQTSKATFYLSHHVQKVEKKEHFHITTDKGVIKAKSLIVASGGESYPKIGGSTLTREIAQAFSHTVQTTSPALVGFTVQKEEFWFKDLSGVSVLAEVSVGDKRFVDNILFTHKGISGPAILNASLYWKKGAITLNFLPKSYKKSNKFLSHIEGLPKRFVLAFLAPQGFKDKPMSESREEIERLQHYTFSPAGTFGYTKAEVMRGGVDTDELDETCQSRLCEGLFFIGEGVNVTGELGGYNFQWAFSSAAAAARALCVPS